MSNCSTGEYAPRSGNRHGRVEYRRTESESPSIAVVRALALYNGVEAIDAEASLYDFVDPDALDSLFADRYDGSPRGAGTVRFVANDAQVVVRSDCVEVYDGENGS